MRSFQEDTMRSFVFAFISAVMIAGLGFTPVSAAAPSASASAATADNSCGDTYTVQRGDWLAHIARYCDVALSEILDLNPDITNPNWIYPGEVLRLTSDADVTITQNHPSEPWHRSNYPVGVYTGKLYVKVSVTRASVGDEVKVTISGFPKDADIDYRLGKKGEEASVIKDGVVDSDGNGSATFTIPSDAETGDYWVVNVLTTEMTKGVQAYSHTIYIVD
jgi:LysM repeat protein